MPMVCLQDFHAGSLVGWGREASPPAFCDLLSLLGCSRGCLFTLNFTEPTVAHSLTPLQMRFAIGSSNNLENITSIFWTFCVFLVVVASYQLGYLAFRDRK